MRELWTPKIYTKHGFVRTDVVAGVRALDVGCGDRKLVGATGVDSLALPAVDVVHDLSSFPWPFTDASFDLVFANHYLEHAENVPRTMEEIYRILAPQGRVVIQVPYFRAVDAMTDPTHLHYFTSQSLDYFIVGTPQFAYRYSAARFVKRGFWYGWPHAGGNLLRQLIKGYAHRHPRAYDQYLSLLIPTECLTWELEKES